MGKEECRPCIACVKRKTMYCPNSIECFTKEDKPHFRDRMMLLEENNQSHNNWKELNKFIEDNLKSLEENATNKKCDNAVAIYGSEMNGFYKVRRKMRELEGNMSEEEWIEKT